jgi:hypothetical protein
MVAVGPPRPSYRYTDTRKRQLLRCDGCGYQQFISLPERRAPAVPTASQEIRHG